MLFKNFYQNYYWISVQQTQWKIFDIIFCSKTEPGGQNQAVVLGRLQEELQTYAPLSTCTELHLSGKFLSLILGQSEVRSSRLPAKFRCSKRVT